MKRIIPLLLCLCLLLTGCLDFQENPDNQTPAPNEQPTPEPTPEDNNPREGGTLRLSMRTPITLNPLLNEDVTVDRVLKLIFEPLTTLDDTLKPTSHLAEINFSSDNTSASLTLRDDAIWSDGTPVSSEDVIFSVNTLRSAPDAAIYKHSIDNIAEIEKVDSKTVKITFVEVFGGTGYMLNFPVIPQHYYKNETNPSSEKNMSPLGNGLFMFDEYIQMKSMTMTQSPYTFRKRAYIEKVEVLLMPDAETELYSFDQGLIDVITLEITEWSKHHSVKQTHYGEFPAMYYDFVGFNHKKNLMQNELFREAVARSTDWNELVSGVYLTHAAFTLSPVNPASWVYDGETPAYPYDTQMAAALLERVRNGETEEADDESAAGNDTSVADTDTEATDAAAYGDISGAAVNETGNDDVINDSATGSNADNTADDAISNENETASEAVVNEPIEIPLLRVMVNEENDERVKIAETLVENLQSLGLEVSLELFPFNEFQNKLSDGDYDIFIGGYNLSVVPDLRFAFHSDGIMQGSNILFYSDPVLDRMLNAAFSAGTENAYHKSLSNAQHRIAEKLPVISLAFRHSAVLTDTRIRGEIKPSTVNMFANVNEWFIVEGD